MAFPPDERRKKYTGRSGGSATVLEGTVCPVCGKGKLRETNLAFGCTEAACKCTVWKDCLQRSGGPALTAKLMTLLLEKKQLQGSTGVLAMADGKILFTPNGSTAPAVSRSLIYERKS
jgi:DNA topoisomerase-3